MPSSRIPVVDISALKSEGLSAQRTVARLIGEACREIGFFYITGHGVTPEMVGKVFNMTSRFFQAPLEFKNNAAFTGVGGNRGFIRLGTETLDPGKPADVKEAFNIGLELDVSDPDLIEGKPFRAANVWPALPGFRSVMLDYYIQMWRVGELLHRAFAIDLGLNIDFFAEKFLKPMATLRLLHYPPMKAPLADGQFGAGEHTDYGNVTLLAVDSSGLRVRGRDGLWLDAPIIPGAFICNIGDCLMRWTNDTYISTPHKVVSPIGRDRYSVAFFLDPDPDVMVSCLPGCSGEGRPAKYPAVRAADFLRSRLEPTYAHSKDG